MSWLRVWSGLLIFLGVFCSPALVPPGQAAPLQVAASIGPLGEFCRQLGGDLVQVQVIIPPGASPHTFEPSPGVLRQAAQAKVLAYIGADLEPWLPRFIASLKGKKPLVVVASDGLPLIREASRQLLSANAHKEKDNHKHQHHHEAGSANPHVWLDPVLAQDICRRLAAALAQADPGNAETYQKNLQIYLEKLARLHERIQQATAGFKIRQFVSFHPSFSYFARRYGLTEAGVIEVAPGREPSPRYLQALVKVVRQAGLKVIFSEPQFSPRLAEVLAQEAGARVLVLDPLGGRPPYGDDYLALMEYNLQSMAAAMQ